MMGTVKTWPIQYGNGPLRSRERQCSYARWCWMFVERPHPSPAFEQLIVAHEDEDKSEEKRYRLLVKTRRGTEDANAGTVS